MFRASYLDSPLVNTMTRWMWCNCRARPRWSQKVWFQAGNLSVTAPSEAPASTTWSYRREPSAESTRTCCSAPARLRVQCQLLCCRAQFGRKVAHGREDQRDLGLVVAHMGGFLGHLHHQHDSVALVAALQAGKTMRQLVAQDRNQDGHTKE